MCAGGQDIPVTLRVAGGVEGGKWKSEEDVRATPPIEEEVETTETTDVTEPVEPSATLYKPVIDRINQLSEKLPDKVAGETVEEMQPMMHHGWGMNDRNHHHTMRMLDRIMRNTSRRPRPPRPGRNGKWGGVAVDPKPQQTLGTQLVANQQLAGLAGLFDRPKVLKPEQTTPSPLPNFPQQRYHQEMATPIQPEIMEQQQMEILGQPKQFAGGGIVNALMATPIGQSAIQEYARGGDITFDSYKHDYGLTGDPLKDILEGLIYNKGTDKERPARFYGSREWLDDPSKGSVVNWGLEEEVEEKETPKLKRIRKILKPKEPHQDSTHDTDPEVDPVTGVTVGHLSEIDYDPEHFKDPEPLSPLAKALAYMAIPGGSILAAADPNFKVKDVWNAIFNPHKDVTPPPTYSYNYGADPGDVAALGSSAFGHTPTDQISRSDIYGESEDAPALSNQQVQDIQSQVDSFSEIADTDSFGGYGGGGGDADADAAGAEEMGGEDM